MCTFFTTKESTNILNTFKTSQNYTMFSYNSTTSTELLTTLQILFHRTSQDFHNTSKLFLIPQNSKRLYTTLHKQSSSTLLQKLHKKYQNFSKLYTTLQNFTKLYTTSQISTNFIQLHKSLQAFFLQYSAKIWEKTYKQKALHNFTQSSYSYKTLHNFQTTNYTKLLQNLKTRQTTLKHSTTRYTTLGHGSKTYLYKQSTHVIQVLYNILHVFTTLQKHYTQNIQLYTNSTQLYTVRVNSTRFFFRNSTKKTYKTLQNFIKLYTTLQTLQIIHNYTQL